MFLPKEILQQVMLLLPQNGIQELALVDRFCYSCLNQNWMWYTLLVRDYSNFCYRESELLQYRQEAETLLTQYGGRIKCALAPAGRYCPARLYQTFFYLNSLRVKWKNIRSDVACLAWRRNHCLKLHVIDLHSPLILNSKLNDSRSTTVLPTWILSIKINSNEIYMYHIKVNNISKRGELYPLPVRDHHGDSYVMIGDDALFVLLEWMVQERFFLSPTPLILPAALYKNNPYFLEYIYQ